MWILVLILSIKLQMPTWYWVLFTLITIFRPFIGIIEHLFLTGFTKGLKHK